MLYVQVFSFSFFPFFVVFLFCPFVCELVLDLVGVRESDLELAVKRWRVGRMSEDERQTRIRRRTVDAAAADDAGMKMSENPARQIEMVGTSITVASL